MTEDDTTDDELAALLASGAWQIREFAYTGTGFSPEEFVTEAADAVDFSLTPDRRERALTVVRENAVDDLVTFKQDTYDGPPAEYAFVWKDVLAEVTLAFDYTTDETARIYDFIAHRGVEVPRTLAGRINR